MKMKQNISQCFHGTYSNLTAYLFYQKILEYFNDFQNRNFSILCEPKQNQTFFHGAYSNLTGHKVLNYFNELYSWPLSVSLQN